jgi:hypothetical protein
MSNHGGSTRLGGELRDSRALVYQYAWTLSNIMQLGHCAAAKDVDHVYCCTCADAVERRGFCTSGSVPKQTTSTRATNLITLCLIASYAPLLRCLFLLRLP